MFLAWGPRPSYIQQMVPSKIASFNEEAFAIYEHSWCPFPLLLMFCLSGVPLCGLGAWWIRQTPSGLKYSLVLMKIKSIISQKIKGSGFPEWSLLPSLLTAWWSVWESSSMSRAWPKIWLCLKDPELWTNLLAPPYDIYILILELTLVRSGIHIDALPGRLAGRGSGKTQTNYFG